MIIQITRLHVSDYKDLCDKSTLQLRQSKGGKWLVSFDWSYPYCGGHAGASRPQDSFILMYFACLSCPRLPQTVLYTAPFSFCCVFCCFFLSIFCYSICLFSLCFTSCIFYFCFFSSGQFFFYVFWGGIFFIFPTHFHAGEICFHCCLTF